MCSGTCRCRTSTPSAQAAAEVAEAAAEQGKFWPMHDLLYRNQAALSFDDLVGYAAELGLDVERFPQQLTDRAYAGRVARDVASADESGATCTPTFFINGRRHAGTYGRDSLAALVRSELGTAGPSGTVPFG